uniref:Portal protein n=1 Tax=viral metagenome TaxID=1070528 RepID=A0A6M3LWZ7_9ZZZZ
MNMPTTLANFLQRDFWINRNKELSRKSVVLTRQIASLQNEIQASFDVTTNLTNTTNTHYIGNPYTTYDTQVTQLGKLYDNLAPWGCMITKNIIDIRTAFSVGEGVDVKKREGFKGTAEKELEWVEDFMQFNNLDEEMPQEYAKEAEIEGKILLRFLVDTNVRKIRLVHVPWRKFKYEISTPDWDFYNYTKAEYIGSGKTGVGFNLPPEWFVYKRFGGSADKVNETPSKTAFVLREIEDLDKAIWDWRKINKLFSMPTPVITCPDKHTATEVNARLDEINWRIGMMLILGGQDVKFELVGWKGDGYTTIKEETQTLVKTISGTTGIPVHFFGYPELLSNRDTAENLGELIALSTSKERRTWIGAYEEVFQKAMIISNTAFGTNLNPHAIDATIKETKIGEKDETVSNSNNTSSGQEPNRGNN